jgi:hypothetical protein
VTIQDYGSIGEIVGAVATVATLAYLAVQIRRSNIIATIESRRATTSINSGILLSIIQNPDVARIWREGLSNRGSLNSDDKIRFDFLLGEYIAGQTEGLMEQDLLGTSNAFADPNNQENIRAFLQTPGGAAWWAKYRGRYDPRVQTGIDGVLAALESPAAQQGAAADSP